MQRSGSIKTEDLGLESAQLLCPRCGGHQITHIGATFFERDEDAPQEVVTAVQGQTTSVSVQSATGTLNPSARRHGVLMHFHCEACSGKGVRIDLAFAQHMGKTEISWRFDPFGP